MKRLNIEIKAHCRQPEKIDAILREKNAEWIGEDHQTDTYFQVNSGRLKLREGHLENHLIHYQRSDQAGPKRSEVLLYRSQPGSSLKDILTAALGVMVVIDKTRSIYFIDNVKFHIDQVRGLGSFVEIEAIDKNGTVGESALLAQCREYMQLLQIKEQDLVAVSYSDMQLNRKT